MKQEKQYPIFVLGLIWLIFSSIFILLGIQGSDHGDKAMTFVGMSIGTTYFVVGVLFVYLDSKFAD